MIFLLLYWSESNNCLMWKVRPPLCSEEEANYPHMLLVLGCWNIVLSDPSSYRLEMDLDSIG